MYPLDPLVLGAEDNLCLCSSHFWQDWGPIPNKHGEVWTWARDSVVMHQYHLCKWGLNEIYQCKHFLGVEANDLEVLEIVYSGDLNIGIC